MSDESKSGKSAAELFRPLDSYREHIDSGRSTQIPPQTAIIKSKGSKFEDISELRVNINRKKLTTEILLDIFFRSWFFLLIAALSLAFFAGALWLLYILFRCFIGLGGFERYHFITRILFCMGFFNLSGAAGCLGICVFKLLASLFANTVKKHLFAIYDFKD